MYSTCTMHNIIYIYTVYIVHIHVYTCILYHCRCAMRSGITACIYMYMYMYIYMCNLIQMKLSYITPISSHCHVDTTKSRRHSTVRNYMYMYMYHTHSAFQAYHIQMCVTNCLFTLYRGTFILFAVIELTIHSGMGQL